MSAKPTHLRDMGQEPKSLDFPCEGVVRRWWDARIRGYSEDPKPCSKRASESVLGKKYCSTHANVALREHKMWLATRDFLFKRAHGLSPKEIATIADDLIPFLKDPPK